MNFTPEQILYFCTSIFFIGGYGMLTQRQNFIGMLISMELMMAACFAAFVTLYCYYYDCSSYMFSMVILAVSAAEVGVGLAIIFTYYKLCHNIQVKDAVRLKDDVPLFVGRENLIQKKGEL